MSKKKILVTGASGMLGRVLVKHLQRFYDVRGVSRSGRAGTYGLDLTDRAEVGKFCELERPDLVVHTAAYSDVDGCERDSALARAANALGTRNLTEALDTARVPFVHVSTDYVFDGTSHMPYREDDRTFPINIYGMTKLEAEFWVRRYRGPAAIVRTSWLFGPENPANFVNAIIDRLRRESRVPVLDDQLNAPTYVVDLSEALGMIAAHLDLLRSQDAANGVCETFHFCNRGGTTRYEMTLKIKELLRLKDVCVERCERDALKQRLAVRPAYTVMSTARYEDFFKVNIRSWEESLRDYLERDAR